MSSTVLSRRQGIAILLLAAAALMTFVLADVFRLAPVLSLSPASPAGAPAVAVPGAGTGASDPAPPPAATNTVSDQPSAGTSNGSNPGQPTQPRSGAPNYLQDAGDGTTNPLPPADCVKVKCRGD